jgi:mono/diheme cytochrome c family protein
MPPDSAPPGSDAGGDAGAASGFALTPRDGNAMTNIGNCVPSQAMVSVETQKSAALDAMFARLQAQQSGTPAQQIGLPERLGDTDLVTLDSAQLAQYGVLAYAPGYPLWSDNAGKLRHVRVPRGTSIHFNKTTQQFDIPPNTRFYKTFMKRIIDTDGSYRYRKIETRLIVSRPDQDNADGTVTQTALYGSYKWTDDESDAQLIETPLNNGRPFADTIVLYNSDEQLAAEVLSSRPAAPEEALLENHTARHYAIPSSQRCVECHRGSPSAAFVLGFTPLQINRRPLGAGGTIEATGLDELNQLQRLIQAGIVTGVDSPSDILPLERSQGSRAPRNDYELVAQGYMLGNCAHCHNPRGLPTVQNPVLKGVLDFLPSATGGIFQFPLERYSPRIGRGVTGTTPIPYITPSLVDLPRIDVSSGKQAADVFVRGTASGGTARGLLYDIYAPWRSIIYRNVDSAFAYTDDLALYPHMPMNTPGYDPRAKQVLADWMVSIPAARKHPELVEYAYQTTAVLADNVPAGSVPDSSPQPYVEVPPGTPGYDEAVRAALERLDVLHTGRNPAIPLDKVNGATYSRYADLGRTDDIFDPSVLLDPICTPVPPGSEHIAASPVIFPFPEHPHWVRTDLTQAPGPWAPRQSNWPSVLVKQKVPPLGGGCTAPAARLAAYADQVTAVQLLPGVTLDQVRAFATTPRPFGLWKQQPGCNFASVPKVQSFTGAQRPHWIDVLNAAPDAPVYVQTPGAAVFKMICVNCHGPQADSNGRLAQNLATMTGGNALVADFRHGLFGPPGASEEASNRHARFGKANLPSGAPSTWTDATDDDRAARYMAWMGLGGTSVNIPTEILQIVAVTKVLDQRRVLSASQLSANMLSQAKALCLGLLGPDGFSAGQGAPYLDPRLGHGYLDAALTHLNRQLLPNNGDAELWMNLCSIANPSPIRVLTLDPLANTLLVQQIEGTDGLLWIDSAAPGSLIAASNYPAGSPVGNERGWDPSHPTTHDPTGSTNLWPWCVDDTGVNPEQDAWLSASSLPRCPKSVKDARHACATQQADAVCFGNDAANRWAVRGAINAGLSVFLYVHSIEDSGPPPDYDQCSALN